MKTMEQTNIDIVTSFIETFWNQRDFNCTDQFLAPDYQENAYLPSDIEGLKRMANQSFKAFPDQHFSIEEIVAQDDKVMVRILSTGTHKGIFRGTDPTGNAIEMIIYREYRLKDGKIVEHRALADTATLLRQIEAPLTPDNACKIK